MSALQLRAGGGMTQTTGRDGQALGRLRAQSRKWRHPWSVRAAWDGDSWTATIKPGYVNGRAPIYRTSLPEQRAQGRDFGTNPLTGQPYFSSFVFARAAVDPLSGQVVDVPLYLAPVIPLQGWRTVGAGGSPVESVPDFFAERGVADFGDEPAPDTRRLVARDLILHQPRLALTAEISQENPFEGQSIARQVLTTRAPLPSDRLRVYAGHYQDPALTSSPDAIDPLASFYEEPNWDELRIATVYLLSPAGAKPGAEPDQTWSAFAAHGLFWNLGWLPARMLTPLDVAATVNPLAGLGVLGAGLLAPITNVFAAATNDVYQQALNQLRARSQAGTWVTPTGGGHTTALPREEIVPIGGTSKAARLEQVATAKARQLAAERRRGATLDPDFPFTAIGFDPARFHLS
jgi:hypothetical protein